MTGHQFLQMRRLSASSWLVRLDFLLIYQFLDTSFLYYQLSVSRQFFLFIACFEMCMLSVCMYRKSIFVSIVILYFSLYFIALCFHLSKAKLPNFLQALKRLTTVVLLINSFLSSFLQVSILRVILLTQANISRLSLSLVQVAQELVCFRKLKFIGLNVQPKLPYTVKSPCTFASQYLASQQLYQLYYLLS